MNPYRSAAVILALGLVMSAGIASHVFYRVRALDQTLSVTGSAKRRITSDRARWHGSFVRNVNETELKRGYAELAQDAARVASFLKRHGFAEAEFTTVSLDQDYSYQQDPNLPKRYALRQRVEVRSGDVDAVTELSKRSKELIDEGVVFSTDPVEYTYSKLPELRIEMLSDAVKDARARAAAIAGESHVGAMRAASTGVVQVLSPDSTEVSDYGTYDTSKIEKDVMTTVRLEFGVR